MLKNPVPTARRTLPFVVLLQSDLADTGQDRVVAPLALETAMPPLAGRLIPLVTVDRKAYALLVPSLTTMPAADLRLPVANLA